MFSNDSGASFTKLDLLLSGFDETKYNFGDMSPTGEYIVIANDSGSVWYSSDYGVSFSTTSISGATDLLTEKEIQDGWF